LTFVLSYSLFSNLNYIYFVSGAVGYAGIKRTNSTYACVWCNVARDCCAETATLRWEE